MQILLLTLMFAAAPEVMSPADSCALAANDILRLAPEDQIFQRYLAQPVKRPDAGPALALTVNASLSHASTIYRPWPVVPDQLYRIDLRRVCPQDADLKRILKQWESLAEVDPWYHTLREKLVTVPPYKHTDGKTYTQKRVNVSEPAIHTGLDKHLLLVSLTQSSVPIVRLDWFVEKAMTTLDGGLYYTFRNYQRNVAGKTDQQLWLERVGASEEQAEKLRSDERSAIFFSGVTSRQRRIDVFYGSGVRPSTGLPIVTITHDLSSAGNDPAADPLINLLKFQDFAREAIAVTKNGQLEYALFNAKGALQDVVPPEVARDNTIPFPFDQQLQPGASCVRCHFLDDGFKPFGNDVQRMLGKLDILDDAAGRKGIADTLDRLAGLYAGSLEPALMQARNGHATAVFLATGGKSVKETGAAFGSLVADYRYRLVTPLRACTDLGIASTDQDALGKLNAALPPLDVEGLPPESGILGALKADVPIQIKQWEANFADAALRYRTVQIREGKIQGL